MGAQRDHETLEYTRQFVASLAESLLMAGASLVTAVGKEPRSAMDVPLVFGWTVLEVARRVLKTSETSPSVAAITSEKAIAEIPSDRQPLWQSLRDSNYFALETLRPGWRSGALLRVKQAERANLLVAVGGGAGTEHLVELHLARGNQVLPLDFPVGSSRDESIGGAESLAREAIANPGRFAIFRNPDRGGALLQSLRFDTEIAPDEFARRTVQVIRELRKPQAFFVRLQNHDVPLFAEVERYFREVVDPVMLAHGYEVFDLTVDPPESQFLNVEIFAKLHRSAIAICDLTGTRPNCMMELGYAFGRKVPVLITARRGTKLPFDPAQMTSHTWIGYGRNERDALSKELKAALQRQPLVQ